MGHLAEPPKPLNATPSVGGSWTEIRAFLKVRNEADRLPHVLDYYRRLGIDRFLIVDNGSTDATRDLLAAARDVHLFAADGSFGAAGGGQAWLDALLDRYGCGHWCLTVDADELLCYADIERTDLPRLCRTLDREGAEALACMMLDMYAHSPRPGAPYHPGEAFLDACPWFDPRPYWRVTTAECPGEEIYGGVRQRLFFPRWERPDLRLRLGERLYDVGNRFGPIRRNTRLQSLREKRPPNLAKVPLVRWRSGMRYLAVTHKITPVGLSSARGALLHFKFLGDFAATAAREAARGEYFDAAREYRSYARVIERNPSLGFWNADSVRYRDSAQLASLGLLTPAHHFAEPAHA